jgi:hypothetical protein
MLSDGLVCQKQFLGVVSIGEYFLVRYQVVDAIMALLADHQAPLAHFVLAETIQITPPFVDRPGNQMMLGQPLPATTQLAVACLRVCFLSVLLMGFTHEALASLGVADVNGATP